MKKWITLLCVITCVFALTGCGSTTGRIAGEPMPQEEEMGYVASGEALVENIRQVVDLGMQDQVVDDPVYGPAIQSWESALKDIGEIEGYQNEYAVYSDKKEVTVNIGIDGTEHDADVVIVASTGTQGAELKSITTNVAYSFGELIEQAALNTLLGMGTTFAVLILLAVLINCFKIIPKIQDSFEKKKRDKAAQAAAVAAPAAAPAAPAAAAPAVPDVSAVDDGALIAVIAAAIVASEGRTSADGFVVRSIRKARRKAQ